MKHPQPPEISPLEQRVRRVNVDAIMLSALFLFMLGFVVVYFLT